jgi:hypothetical protein
MLPDRRGTFNDPALHELRIVLKARAKVLFGANEFGDGHESMISV